MTNLNSAPFRWRLHKKTLQAITADMTIATGCCCLFDRGEISLVILGVLLDVIMFADLLYMRYYKNPLTISVIIHNIRVMKEAKESAFALLKAKDLLCFLDIPLMILFLWGMHFLDFPYIDIASYFLGSSMVIIGGIWLSLVYYYSNREPYKWNRKRIARDLGILFFHMSDILREISGKIKRVRHLPEAQVKMVHQQFVKPQKNLYTNCCKDKRFIMVQMESMQDYLIGMEINGREVTPNLNKLMKENIRFSNMYYQTSTTLH